jgi:hypothetical protein
MLQWILDAGDMIVQNGLHLVQGRAKGRKFEYGNKFQAEPSDRAV